MRQVKNAKIIVIVRAFEDEPVKLSAIGESACGAVEVCGQDESLSIGFQADHVFAFDDNLYRKLKHAFDRHDRKELDGLWRQAKPFQTEAA